LTLVPYWKQSPRTADSHLIAAILHWDDYPAKIK
jgi:hypothetical protein